MLKTKHTPGPWLTNLTITQRRSVIDVAAADGSNVAQALTGDNVASDDVARANARLISVAPDLLFALQLLMEQDKNGESEQWIRDYARVAIIRATGEQELLHGAAMPKRPPLNFREWWDTVGTENVRKVVEDLDSSIPYFRLLRYGLKKPGSAQALRIIDAARRHTAPFEPDLELLLRGVPRAGKDPAKPIPPSDRFVRARKRIESAEPVEA